MILHPETRPINVLLYTINVAAASQLTALLTSQNMAVTTAHSLQDLQDAIRRGGLDVAITSTVGVEITRQVTSLPVINFDAFVFTSPGREVGQGQRKQLDSAAFINRLLDVARAKNTLKSTGDRGLSEASSSERTLAKLLRQHWWEWLSPRSRPL